MGRMPLLGVTVNAQDLSLSTLYTSAGNPGSWLWIIEHMPRTSKSNSATGIRCRQAARLYVVYI